MDITSFVTSQAVVSGIIHHIEAPGGNDICSLRIAKPLVLLELPPNRTSGTQVGHSRTIYLSTQSFRNEFGVNDR